MNKPAETDLVELHTMILDLPLLDIIVVYALADQIEKLARAPLGIIAFTLAGLRLSEEHEQAKAKEQPHA